ncbi:MAG: hypothetical protein WC462_01900 [archaeon]
MRGKKKTIKIKNAKKKPLFVHKKQHFFTEKKLLFFVAKFFIIFAVLNILIELADLSFLTNFIASISASFLNAQYLHNVVFVKSFFIITNSCTGFVSASILASIIFALRKPALKKKIILFLLGTAVLLIVNIPRIIFVLYMSKIGFNAELMHEMTWFLMSAIVLAIWYYGTKRVEGIKEFNELL